MGWRRVAGVAKPGGCVVAAVAASPLGGRKLEPPPPPCPPSPPPLVLRAPFFARSCALGVSARFGCPGWPPERWRPRGARTRSRGRPAAAPQERRHARSWQCPSLAGNPNATSPRPTRSCPPSPSGRPRLLPCCEHPCGVSPRALRPTPPFPLLLLTSPPAIVRPPHLPASPLLHCPPLYYYHRCVHPLPLPRPFCSAAWSVPPPAGPASSPLPYR